MNEYRISHKIKTLTELWEPIEYNDFKFRQWDFTLADGPKGEAWIAEKKIEAGNLLEAIDKFRKDLLEIVQQCCFISQCYFSLIPESWMVIKENDNTDKIFFLRFTRETEAVSLPFNKGKLESLKKLQSFERKPAFMYLNESTNASTFYTRLAMLIIALESIAGEEKPQKTNKKYIEDKILKDDILYREIFAPGVGIRNKIFHGKEVNITEDYVDKIYKKIVEYFNSEFDTQVSLDVKHPLRTPWGYYKEMKGFFKAKNGRSRDFREIVEKLNDSTSPDFCILEDYEYIPKENYEDALRNF